MTEKGTRGVRVPARITFPVLVLRHLSGKARGLRIVLGMEGPVKQKHGQNRAQIWVGFGRTD